MNNPLECFGEGLSQARTTPSQYISYILTASCRLGDLCGAKRDCGRMHVEVSQVAGYILLCFRVNLRGRILRWKRSVNQVSDTNKKDLESSYMYTPFR